MAQHEVFASAVGGVRLTEPGADLAVCLAVASAWLDRPLPARSRGVRRGRPRRRAAPGGARAAAPGRGGAAGLRAARSCRPTRPHGRRHRPAPGRRRPAEACWPARWSAEPTGHAVACAAASVDSAHEPAEPANDALHAALADGRAGHAAARRHRAHRPGEDGRAARPRRLGPEVLAICSGGFLLDADFSPQRLSELAKMDGAIILAPTALADRPGQRPPRARPDGADQRDRHAAPHRRAGRPLAARCRWSASARR